MADISPGPDYFEERRRGADESGRYGGFRPNAFCEGVAEPIFARTLVTRAGDQALVLMTADLSTIQTDVSAVVRSEVARRHGLPGACITIACSHNHSAPPLAADTPYARQVISALVASAGTAFEALEPARIGATTGYCPSIAYNERLPLTKETPREFYPHPRHLGGVKFSRDHLEARTGGRPTDPQVGVIRLDRADGTLLGLVVNFAAHAATEIEPERVSGDYVGFALAKIARSLPRCCALFCQGAAAGMNINHIFGTLDDARRSGEALAEEVLRVVDDARTTDRVEIGWQQQVFQLEFDPLPPREELEDEVRVYREFLNELARDPGACWFGDGRKTINLPPKYPAVARQRMVLPLIEYNERALAGNAPPNEPLRLELQTFRWNEIALALNPMELFVQTGLEIKRLSPFRHTYPVCYANACCGYVPPPEEVALGGYNVVTAYKYSRRPGPVAATNAHRAVRQFVKMLQETVAEGSAEGGE